MRFLTAAMALGLTCSAAGTVQSGETDAYKILKLEGNQVSWHRAAYRQPLVVTYRIVSDTVQTPGARNCRRMTAPDALLAASSLDATTLRTEIAAAFDMWEAVADINFRAAETSTKADILIGAQVDPEGWAFTDVFYDVRSPDAVKPISSALICLNPAKRWKVGFDGDLKVFDLRYTIAHEIGHAIGLDHPEAPGQIMGYRYEESFRALQAGDIAGAIRIYGAHQQPATAEVAAAAKPRSTRLSLMRRFARSGGTRAFSARSP